MAGRAESGSGRGGRWGDSCVPPHARLHDVGGFGGGGIGSFLLASLSLSLCLSRSLFFLSLFPWGASLYFLGHAWGEGKRGACNVPPLRGLRTGKMGKNVRRHDLDRSNASMIKQKKNHRLYQTVRCHNPRYGARDLRGDSLAVPTVRQHDPSRRRE